MRRTAVIVPAVLLSLAVALAACSSSTNGNGSSKNTTGGQSTSATSASSQTSAPNGSTGSNGNSGSAPDKAKLATFVLTQADVPSGWTGTPASTDNSNDADEAKLDQCLGIPDSSKQQVAEADSPDFSMSDSTISSSATSYPSQSIVDQDVAGITGPKANACIKQSFQSSLQSELPSGTTVNNFDITITPGSNGGPSNVVAEAHGQISVTVKTQTAALYLDVAFITGHQVEGEVDFFGFGTRIDAAAQAKAINAVATRIAKG